MAADMTCARHFCTTAHAAYLPRLRVLHASMQRHCAPFILHVLAEGREVEEWAVAQPDIICKPVGDFLSAHPDLLPAALPGPPRNGNELACTWRWRFVCDLIERYDQPVTLVDADVMFWARPDPVFEEIGSAPAAFIPHAFAPAAAGLPGPTIESHGRYGRLNGGLSYWADPAAADRMAALTRMHSRADDYVMPNGRTMWGDQSWLEIVEEEFGAHVIRNPRISLAPWNVHAVMLEGWSVERTQEWTPEGPKGQRLLSVTPLVNGHPLIAYHYSSYIHGQRVAYTEYEITQKQFRILYAPYAAELEGLVQVQPQQASG